MEELGHEEGAVTEEAAHGGSQGTAQRPPRSFTCHFLVTPPCPRQHQESVFLAVERRLSLPYTSQPEKGTSLLISPTPNPKQLFRQGALWKLPSCSKQVQLPGRARPERFGHHLLCGGRHRR